MSLLAIMITICFFIIVYPSVACLFAMFYYSVNFGAGHNNVSEKYKAIGIATVIGICWPITTFFIIWERR